MSSNNVSNPNNHTTVWINGGYENVQINDNGFITDAYGNLIKDENGMPIRRDALDDIYGINSDENIRKRQLTELDKKIEEGEKGLEARNNVLDYFSNLFYSSMELASEKGKELRAFLSNNNATDISDITDKNIRDDAQEIYDDRFDARSMQHRALGSFLSETHATVNDIQALGDLKVQRIYLS